MRRCGTAVPLALRIFLVLNHLSYFHQICLRNHWLLADAAAKSNERVHESDADAQAVEIALMLALLLGGARHLVAEAARDPRMSKSLLTVVTLDLRDPAHATNQVLGLGGDIRRIVPHLRLYRRDLQSQCG